jgi:hypothetical protein
MSRQLKHCMSGQSRENQLVGEPWYWQSGVQVETAGVGQSLVLELQLEDKGQHQRRQQRRARFQRMGVWVPGLCMPRRRSSLCWKAMSAPKDRRLWTLIQKSSP